MAKNKKATDDLAVLHQVLALHGGQLDDFRPTPPPTPIKRFLRKANLYELQWVLVEILAAMRENKSLGLDKKPHPP